MRYIDLSKLTISHSWQTNAANALMILRKKNKFERTPYIELMRGKTWANASLVASLVALVNKKNPKCWYSEAYITGDPEVDHFRPKSKNISNVFKNQYKTLDKALLDEVEDENNFGWWFLAFDYKNYRVCNCTVNQLRRDKQASSHSSFPLRAKGKADYFPLKKGSPVAINTVGLNDELNCLLDPCNPNDPEYIAYNDKGEPYALYNASLPLATWIRCRAEISIAVYHLDRTQLNDCRQHKWRECQRVIESMKDSIIAKDIKKSVKLADYYVKDLADKSKEFSAVAIDCIRHYYITQNYKWLYQLIEMASPGIQLNK